MSNPATLDDLRQVVFAGVRRVGQKFTRPDDDWAMLAFMQRPEGLNIIVLPNALFANGMRKDVLGEYLRLEAANGAYRFALLLNVHGIALDTEEDDVEAVMEPVHREELRVEQMEGAYESLWLHLGDAETEQHWTALIERTPRMIRKLAPWVRQDGGETTFSGRFVGLNEYMRLPRR